MARRFDLSEPLTIPLAAPHQRGQLSVFIWFKLTSAPNYSRIFSKLPLLISINSINTIQTHTSQLPIRIKPIPLNEWCNIGFTYKDKTLTTYLNNEVIRIDKNYMVIYTPDRITIGQYFPGSLAELGIWSTCLSQDDIDMLSNRYLPTKVCPNSLVEYISFIEYNEFYSEHPSMVVPTNRNLTGAG